jgi:hypothetical protein
MNSGRETAHSLRAKRTKPDGLFRDWSTTSINRDASDRLAGATVPEPKTRWLEVIVALKIILASPPVG